MNTVTIIGRLAKDPDTRYTSGGSAVCRLTVAVDRPVRDGEEKKADFLPVTVFGRSAENCGKYLAKGRQVAVQGRIQTGSYKNRDGQTVYTTDIIADRVEFIGSAPERQGRQEAPKTQQRQRQETFSDYYDEDLPDSFYAADDVDDFPL